MPIFDFSVSDNPVAQKIENNNRIQEDDDDLTDYNGSGYDSQEEDLENIIFFGEYYNCYICKKECQVDEDYYLLDWDKENEKLISAICYDCKKKEIEKECITCGKEFENNDNYIKEVRYLLYNYGKIEECISCMVINNKLKIKPIELENNIIKVDTLYEEITEDIRDKLISKEIKDDDELNGMEDCEAYDELNNKYNFNYNHSLEISEKLEYIYVAHKLGYGDLTRNLTMNIFKKILNDFDFNFDYISLKEDNNIYVLYNKEKDVKNVDILENNTPKNDDDLYFINLKHKKLNYKLLQFLNKTKIIKNNKPPSIESNFYKNIKVKSIELRNNIKNNVLSKYNGINEELNLIQKEIDEMEKVLPIYDKLKENNNILEIQNEGVNDLQKLFIKLKNDKINEYTTMSNIGKNIIDNNLNNNEIKEILIGYNKDRINRIIIKCKRISILSNYVNINILANSGISHFLRDSNEESFNKLIDFIKINPLDS